MRILFVWPNKDTFGFKPIGVSLLMAVCRQNGHEVDLFETTFIDFGYIPYADTLTESFVFKPIDMTPYNLVKVAVSPEEELRKKLETCKPDVVAFSVLSDEAEIAYRCARAVKQWNAHVITIFGGKHPTLCPEEVLSQEVVDFVCISEGLEALPEWLAKLDRGLDPYQVRNIWGKKGGTSVRNPVRPLKTNLDDLPFLWWDKFDTRDFIKSFDGKVYRGGDFMANWGCVYECSYCINRYLHDLHGRTSFVRRYSPSRAISELKFLADTYQLEFLKFHDEDFLLRDNKSLMEFARLYKEKIGLPFVIETNPLSVNKEKASLLKNMNCVSASLGVESGNEYIRKQILKRHESREQIIKAFNYLNEAGIRTVAFLMLGLPFDSREAIFDSIELMRAARVRAPNIGIFFPFEKTELREISIKNGFYDPREIPVYTINIPALNQKTLERDEVIKIRRVFNFYVKLPRSYWPLIRRTEESDETGREIFKILREIYIRHVRDQGDSFNEVQEKEEYY